ncbi:MAG: ABC transporter ATP-binding protein [Bacteroidia bacterium]|nr:ABC transporter ATP-binding protein [Bacteroidia bacterium]
MQNTPIIEIKKLVKSYRGAKDNALKGIDLNIYKGEIFGLLGPNAAGKTTLISIICGLLSFNEGEVIVNGTDIKHSSKKIRSDIGLVPQDVALYQHLTIKENLKYFGSLQGLYGKKLKERVEEFLEVVKLKPYQSKLISKCSGGIKRRVNLVAGLIHKPSILFLDEPTVGVDAQSRNLIFEYLLELNKKGITIIFSTHYMKEAEKFCERIIIIDNGEIIASGKPDDLIKSYNTCNDLADVFLKLTGKELRE